MSFSWLVSKKIRLIFEVAGTLHIPFNEDIVTVSKYGLKEIYHEPAT
jgi:hypothetical protein